MIGMGVGRGRGAGSAKGARFRGDGTTEEEREIRPAAIVVHILLLRGDGRGRPVVGLV